MTNGLAVDTELRDVQVVPPLSEYRSVVVAEPPLPPSVNAIVKRPLPGAIEEIVGANGVRDGIALVADDGSPSPMRFTARTLTA